MRGILRVDLRKLQPFCCGSSPEPFGIRGKRRLFPRTGGAEPLSLPGMIQKGNSKGWVRAWRHRTSLA